MLEQHADRPDVELRDVAGALPVSPVSEPAPPLKVISALAGGEAAIGGTFAAVIGGAPGPRGIVCTTWLGGSGRALAQVGVHQVHRLD